MTAPGRAVRDLPPRQPGALILRFVGDLSHPRSPPRSAAPRRPRAEAARDGLREDCAPRRVDDDDLARTPLSASRRGDPRAAAGRRGRSLRRRAGPSTSPTRVSNRRSAPLAPPTSPAGSSRLAYDDHNDRDDVSLAPPRDEHLPARRRGARAARRTCARQLEQYFAGRAPAASRSRSTGPRARLQRVACSRRRPASRTAHLRSYRDVADRRGQRARGSRAAGNALGAHPIPIVVPCHRVVRTGGKLGGYTGGLDRKQTLLAVERGELTLAM